MWDPAVVKLLQCDMRDWEGIKRHLLPSEGAHIVVSELLGSFGDNELSPECLSGVSSVLNQYGVSIPYQYTSYLAPLTSAKLWMQARDLYEGKGLGMPFVVNMYSCQQLAKAESVFTFTHANGYLNRGGDNQKKRNNNNSNSAIGAKIVRVKNLAFDRVEQDCTMHGFVGYFDAIYTQRILKSIPMARW